MERVGRDAFFVRAVDCVDFRFLLLRDDFSPACGELVLGGTRRGGIGCIEICAPGRVKYAFWFDDESGAV